MAEKRSRNPRAKERVQRDEDIRVNRAVRKVRQGKVIVSNVAPDIKDRVSREVER